MLPHHCDVGRIHRVASHLIFWALRIARGRAFMVVRVRCGSDFP